MAKKEAPTHMIIQAVTDKHLEPGKVYKVGIETGEHLIEKKFAIKAKLDMKVGEVHDFKKPKKTPVKDDLID